MDNPLTITGEVTVINEDLYIETEEAEVLTLREFLEYEVDNLDLTAEGPSRVLIRVEILSPNIDE
jgi:hypothetical protein